MKKIGIVTISDNRNFGNRLQNYALKYVLEKLDSNFDVHSIWFINSFLDIFKQYIKKVLPFSSEIRRYNCFSRFTNKYLNVHFIKCNKGLNKYDKFVVGSDQVWNYNFVTSIDKMFLSFSENKENNISYAASFGISNIKDEYKKEYARGINNIGYVSVREYAGKDIIKELTGRDDVEVLVDPTMLLTTEDWEKIIRKPKMLKESKYILTYFLGHLSEERKKEIERIAKENDCDIINILDKDGPFYATGPSEFLYLEKNAFLICTDSFHSCVFAILFNRPFIIFDREDKEIKMNSRIETLINKFELKNRKYEGKITKENINHDYTKAYKILEKEREKSIKYLEKSLNISRE